MLKRPKSDNPIFEMHEPEIVIKGQSPIERQRAKDGTPHTVTGVQCDSPKGPDLYLGSDKISKSTKTPKPDVAELMKSINPAKIVKSYLGIDEDEDEEKGVGSAVAKLGKQAAGAVYNLAKPK